MTVDPILLQYTRQWGAAFVPFSDGHGSFFEADQSRRAVELLDQSAALRSIMLLTGDNGIGKSALLGRWMRNLDTRIYFPVPITQSTLTGTALLAFFAEKLGKKARLSRTHNLRLIEHALGDLGKVVPILICDESQGFGHGALEELRLLMGLNLSENPSFALILAGDNYLPSALQLQSNRALYSRIAAHYRLTAFNRSQIEAYVEHTFSTAGIKRQVVEPGALELLASASQGVPRVINLLMRRAWIEASADKGNVISIEHMQRALELVPASMERAS